MPVTRRLSVMVNSGPGHLITCSLTGSVGAGAQDDVVAVAGQLVVGVGALHLDVRR